MENLPAPPVKEGNWIPLTDRAVFRITGPDRVRYLNGQVSNNVSKNLEAESIAACVCTLKGKVEALVWISSDGESLIIDGELNQREQLFNRLDRYLIADDCELHDITGQLSLIHHFSASGPGVTSRRALTTGKDLWIKEGETPPFSEDKRITSEAFEHSQLLAKIPKAGFEITANEFPAELGLDRWAVDFHKGCYLGQEVISRIESVGRARRSLLLSTSTEPVQQDEAVTGQVGETGVQAVTTRASVHTDKGSNLTLVLAKISSKGAGVEEPISIKRQNEG
ncbi:MAG: hypothetical protein P1U86_14810 [Verrucomicrobiales bacterium]|nr:hypothetical protein [Verrucomicrobiales bacterium]